MKLEKLKVIEITNKEASSINGGETLWYWIMYRTGNAFRDSGSSTNVYGNAMYYK